MPRLQVRFISLILLGFAAVLLGQPARGQDTVIPAEVTGLGLDLSGTGGGDLAVAWDPVTLDALGAPETVDHYRIYRGIGPHFPLDFTLIGTSPTPDYLDEGGASDGQTYYYVATAVDAAGNEGSARPSGFTTLPALSGFWTATTIELSWTGAEPAEDVASYRVYYGPDRRTYAAMEDVGLATSHSLTGLTPNMNWFAAVVAVDVQGNESALSNEHFDALGGTINVRAHDESRLCYGGCPPQPGEIQRRSGKEILVPVDFPEGDWVNVTLTFTVDSRLCVAPIAPDKCGDQNPGWNPCGDPWDRTASVYLVLNDCIDTGGNCYGQQGNLELLHAVTPFGTDAEPPDGTGVVDPPDWTFDITPYAPLLTGTKYVGSFIGVWVSPGWYVTVDFHFSEDPAEASPTPPADGIVPVWFRDGGNSTATVPVTIPSNATDITARLFTTGHGGVTSADCNCGSGQPCDEFCSKWVSIFVDGGLRTKVFPWRTDCSPLGEWVCGAGTCQEWNACGCPSCTFNRSGWCPGYISCHTDPPCDQDLDADAWFTLGATHDVNVNVLGMTPGASWANSLAIYWYETP